MKANSGHVKDHTEEQQISQTWSITKGQKVSDVAAGEMTWQGITHFDNSSVCVKAYLGVVKEWTKSSVDGKAIISNFLNAFQICTIKCLSIPNARSWKNPVLPCRPLPCLVGCLHRSTGPRSSLLGPSLSGGKSTERERERGQESPPPKQKLVSKIRIILLSSLDQLT